MRGSRYDVILLDLSLPDSDGAETYRRVREAAEVAIVVLTGNADDAIARNTLRLGVEDFLVKHLVSGGELLLRSIRFAIERRKWRAERARLDERLQRGVAHDFNNLLVGILGNAGLLLEDIPPESSLRETVRDIEHAALAASDLTKQLLAYSGRGRFHGENFDISSLARESADFLGATVPSTVNLRYRLSAVPLTVRADSTQFRQILLNLVTNGTEALNDEPGTITITTKAVERDGGDFVCMEVSDTGAGMTDETKEHIFDPFFTTKFAGRGLGLAAVQGIVRGHRGLIRVRSEPGEGATIQVLLPRLDPVRAEEKAVRRPRVRGARRLLVVDDDDSVRTVAASVLKRSGYDEVDATRGLDGAALAGFLQKPFRPQELMQRIQDVLDA